MLHRLLVLLMTLALGLVALPGVALAAPTAKDPGKSVADDAAVAFKEQRFREAAELFEKAYALGTDKFVRLRNAGRAWEEAGKLEYARTQFQRYLDKVPSGPDHDEVAQRLTRLEARLAEQKAAPVAPAAVAVAAPQREVTSQPAVEATAPLAQVEATAQPSGKWLAWTLVGGGGALVAGGVAWLVMTESANGRLAEQSAAGLYSTQKEADDRSTISRNRIGAASLLGAGAVGIVVGSILAARPASDSQVGPLWLPGGGGIAWNGRF